MERSLMITNANGNSLLLEKEELVHFEEVFSYLYDEKRCVNIVQPVDETFLTAWGKFNQNLLSEINKNDALHLFVLSEYVLFQYNLNPIAVSVRLQYNPTLNQYLNQHGCSLSEAIEKTEQSHLWA